MKPLLNKARLYGILDTGYCPPEQFPEMAEALIRGGVEILQIRAKGIPAEEIIPWSVAVSKLTRPAGVPLILNDHPDAVEPGNADGCHVGQDDFSVAQARSMMPIGSLCGKSTHSLEQATDAMLEQPDYIGFGPLFSTPTKPDYGEIGLSDITSMMSIVDVPAFCIGGIKLENIDPVLEAGGKRVVIVSGLLLSKDPENYAQKVRKALDGIPL
jgi:thiamine-phosphate pyrophosphorylase